DALCGGSQRGLAGEHALIYGQIVTRHAAGAESLLENFAAAAPAETCSALDRSDRVLHTIDHEAGHTVFDHLGNGAVPIGDDRRAASHGFDENHPERLWPIDREQQGEGVAEEFVLLAFADLSDVVR